MTPEPPTCKNTLFPLLQKRQWMEQEARRFFKFKSS